MVRYGVLGMSYAHDIIGYLVGGWGVEFSACITCAQVPSLPTIYLTIAVPEAQRGQLKLSCDIALESRRQAYFMHSSKHRAQGWISLCQLADGAASALTYGINLEPQVVSHATAPSRADISWGPMASSDGFRSIHAEACTTDLTLRGRSVTDSARHPGRSRAASARLSHGRRLWSLSE